MTILQDNDTATSRLFQKTKLTLDPDSHKHIMNSMTYMYRDPHEALLREIVANAFDSHMRAGQTKPINVSLSYNNDTDDDGELIIEDFGIGMSRDDLNNIYPRFGNTTKRNNTQQTGDFGFGSKSVLAVTSTYTFTSYHNGKRNTVFVSPDENNIPEFNFLDEVNDDHENGFVVTIPISKEDYNLFRDRLTAASRRNVFFGYPKESINLNGKPFDKIFNEEKYISYGSGLYISTANLYRIQNLEHVLSNAVLLSGPNSYKLDQRFIKPIMEKMNEINPDVIYSRSDFVLRVKNKSISFIPSREHILYDKKTIKSIAEQIVAGFTQYTKIIHETAEKFNSYEDAFLGAVQSQKDNINASFLYENELVRIPDFNESNSFKISYANGRSATKRGTPSTYNTVVYNTPFNQGRYELKNIGQLSLEKDVNILITQLSEKDLPEKLIKSSFVYNYKDLLKLAQIRIHNNKFNSRTPIKKVTKIEGLNFAIYKSGSRVVSRVSLDEIKNKFDTYIDVTNYYDKKTRKLTQSLASNICSPSRYGYNNNLLFSNKVAFIKFSTQNEQEEFEKHLPLSTLEKEIDKLLEHDLKITSGLNYLDNLIITKLTGRNFVIRNDFYNKVTGPLKQAVTNINKKESEQALSSKSLNERLEEYRHMRFQKIMTPKQEKISQKILKNVKKSDFSKPSSPYKIMSLVHFEGYRSDDLNIKYLVDYINDVIKNDNQKETK